MKMFQSSEHARSFRQSLPKRPAKSVKKSLAAFTGGPFSAFDCVERSVRSDSTTPRRGCRSD